MKKYKVIKDGIQISGWTSDENLDETYWQESFGKPERWVLHKDEPMAEAYDDADVLSEEIREFTPAIPAVLDEQGVEIAPAMPAITQKFVKLRSEYTVEIVDLDQDPVYLLQQCHAKRQAEYPSLGEFADSFVKMQNGDSSQMEAYVSTCLAVKAKYPKP